MKSAIFWIPLTCLICLNPVFSAQQSVDLIEKQAEVKAQSVQLMIPWDKNTSKAYKLQCKVTKETKVSLKVTRFNFIRYTLKLDVKSEEIQSYKSLEKLWGDFFNVLPLQRKPTEKAVLNKNPFLTALKEWRDSINVAQYDLANVLTNDISKKTTLNDSDSTQISVLISKQSNRVNELERLRKSAYLNIFTTSSDAPNSEIFIANQLYGTELASHKAIVDRINAFLDLAKLATYGNIYQLEKKESGNLVTISLTTHAIESENQTMADKDGETIIQYFVSSDLPVVFHVGLVYSHLKEVDFEKVRSLQGNDVFQQISKPSGTENLVAFLSYELASAADGKTGWLFTIGTNVTEPGKKVYLGFTVKLVGRVFLTGGTSTTLAKTGTNEMTQDVFQSIKNEQIWGGFFGGVSISPF